MNQRRGRDKPIAIRLWVWHMQARAASGNSSINRQNAIDEGRQDILVQPSTQDRALGWVFSFELQNADFQLLDDDSRKEKATFLDCLNPCGNIGMSLACPDFPQLGDDVCIK